MDVQLDTIETKTSIQLDEYIGLNMIGQSPAFLDVIQTVERIAAYNVTTSIYGETGTGKELIARAVHYLSSRKAGPFVPINCGALPDTLLENELFGHARGAYTDARGEQSGLIAQAENGTLFLDEIETLSQRAQVTLLRFLQDGQYRPLGSQKSYQSDVRIVTASNIPTEELLSSGQLRQDLYYRLNVVSLTTPPLRERGQDVSLLANYFLLGCFHQYNGTKKTFAPEALDTLLQYSWPGNVRELENTVHRAYCMSVGDVISREDIQLTSGSKASSLGTSRAIAFDLPFSEAKALTIKQFEKSYVSELFQRAEGNVTLAAKLAGKERRTFGKLLAKHNIQYRT